MISYKLTYMYVISKLTVWALSSIKSIRTKTYAAINQICTSSIILTRFSCTLIYIWSVECSSKLSNQTKLPTEKHFLVFLVKNTIFTVFTNCSIEPCYTITLVIINMVCTCTVILTRVWQAVINICLYKLDFFVLYTKYDQKLYIRWTNVWISLWICQQFLYWIEDGDCNITTYLFKPLIKKFKKKYIVSTIKTILDKTPSVSQAKKKYSIPFSLDPPILKEDKLNIIWSIFPRYTTNGYMKFNIKRNHLLLRRLLEKIKPDSSSNLNIIRIPTY